MRPRTRRVVAIVVVVALVAGTIAGAFLLRTSSSGSEAALRAAAQQTLRAPSHHAETVSIGKDRVVGTEDFIAPDRYRLGGSPPFDGSPELSSILIGTTFYHQSACTEGGKTTFSWTRQAMPARSVNTTNAAATVAQLIDGATQVRFLRRDDGGDHFAFVPSSFRAGPATFEFSNGRATVVAGRLREVSYRERISYEGDVQSGTVRSRFSQYGSVPPIEAPPIGEPGSRDPECSGSIPGISPNTSSR